MDDITSASVKISEFFFFTTIGITLFDQSTVKLIITGRESRAVQVYEMIYAFTSTHNTYDVFRHALYS